jgi:hypothetical protein
MADTDNSEYQPPNSDNKSKVSAHIERMPNGEPVPDKVIDDKTGKLRPIRPRERIFAMAYGCPDSATFLNARQSYSKAFNNSNLSVCATEGHRLVNNPHVRNTITDILNKANLGVEVRADTIHSILSTKDLGTTTTETVKTEDGTSKVVTRRAPGYNHVLKAIDLVNKMDGLYERNQAAADVAVSEWRELSKRLFGPAPRRAGGGGLTSRRGRDVSLVPKAGENIVSGGSSLEKVTEGENT